MKLSIRTCALPVAIGALGMALSFVGCGGDDNEGGGGLSAMEMTERGWTSFEAGDYNAALADFQAALDRDGGYSDAWNGAGWSAGRTPGKLAEAKSNFATCYTLDTTKYDALGGWAFASYQSGEFNATLSKADSLLTRRPGWRFLHEPTLDFNDVRLLTAKSYYNLENYTASYNVVVTYLNSSFEADVATPSGRVELLRELERLGQIYG